MQGGLDVGSKLDFAHVFGGQCFVESVGQCACNISSRGLRRNAVGVASGGVFLLNFRGNKTTIQCSADSTRVRFSHSHNSTRPMARLTQTPAWRALKEHHAAISGLHMRDLFARDPERFRKFTLQADDILLDYSKNRITEETMALLVGARPADGCRGVAPADV